MRLHIQTTGQRIHKITSWWRSGSLAIASKPLVPLRTFISRWQSSPRLFLFHSEAMPEEDNGSLITTSIIWGLHVSMGGE